MTRTTGPAPSRIEGRAGRKAARRRRGAASLTATVTLAAVCARPPAGEHLAPPDCPPVSSASRSAGFRAGLGRADLTPPPGPGLLGYGPEGRAARGYRQRIQARALVMQDGRGEHIAFVAVDLDFVSGALHREAAARVQRCTGLGADRLVVAATHTHSGPAHFAAHRAYDELGSSVSGYDPAMLEFLANRIARSVLDAFESMRPAAAAWGRRPVWGLTRIRSWPAHIAEPHEWPSPYEPPPELPLESQHVDPTFTLLRIDTIGAAGTAPAGAFSVFTTHGTGNPSANDLFDADVFAGAQRRLERHIDSINGRAPGFRPHAVHVMVNGAEGDVIPIRDTADCRLPVLARAHRPGSYRSPPSPEVWHDPPPESRTACLAEGRRAADAFGVRLGRESVSLFDSLAARLTPDFELSRAFETVSLRGPEAVPGLCSRGRTGTAAVAGAETGRSRLDGWRFGGIFDVGFREGAARQGDDCQSPKRTVPGFLERILTGEHPFEEAAQFTVARIGPVVLATVPFEATTTAGARIRASLAAASGVDPGNPVLVGLANGYLQYVTTPAEYARQHYEGASTLYGPNSLEVHAGRLVELARQLAAADWISPDADVKPFPTWPGKRASVLPSRREPDPTLTRTIRSAGCAGDTVVVQWIDGPPGVLFPADGQVLAIDRRVAGSWHEIAWDDDPGVEVRALRPLGRGHLWEVRWLPVSGDGPHRIRLLARPRLPAVSSRAIEVVNGRCDSSRPG